ncbi:MAG: hypothetical protein HY403_10690 [Elusimicrobia bacterium]|nr:hypothetical protein [Elusimicrobiota bacterium]
MNRTLRLALASIGPLLSVLQAGAVPPPRSPISICLSPDELKAYVVNQDAASISVLDLPGRRVLGEIVVGPRPSHAAVSPDGKLIFVSSTHGDRVDVVDLSLGRVIRSLPASHEPYGVALSTDARKLFVANSLSDTVSVIEPATGRRLSEIRTGRSPRFISLIPGRPTIAVSNGLSRSLSIIDAENLSVRTVELPAAAILRQLAGSPDGRWVFAAHVVSREPQVAVQMERGWIHANGFSIVDLGPGGRRVTLLLDRLLEGAANPWGVTLSADARSLYVSLAGVHEVAIVDVEKALDLMKRTPDADIERLGQDVEIMERLKISRRLPSGGLGPRGLALAEASQELLIANFFSDTVTILDARSGALKATIPLGPPAAKDEWREGELLFNDARITFQKWFSCASCHQEDATIDGLNWDLPNDGVGNPKNVKSLHDIHDSPPAMWTAVREDMDAAVAAGQRFGGFLPDPKNHKALMTFLSRPKRAPNPYRAPELKISVRRGHDVFVRARCPSCHPAPLYTDLKLHDLGLGKASDPSPLFDTPSLRECYRTAPYLHDGRAKTLEEIFTHHDPRGAHGQTRALAKKDVADLAAYLKSL